MKKFEIGKTYTMNSACDHNCVWAYTVTARTACTITLTDKHGETIKRRIIKDISSWRNAESIMPHGNYSMAPILSADKEVASMEAVEQSKIEARKAEERARIEAQDRSERQLLKLLQAVIPQPKPQPQPCKILYLADYR